MAFRDSDDLLCELSLNPARPTNLEARRNMVEGQGTAAVSFSIDYRREVNCLTTLFPHACEPLEDKDRLRQTNSSVTIYISLD